MAKSPETRRDVEPAPIAGLILAAGMSRRLGRPKQLLLIDNKPLLAHVVERALRSRLDVVTVIVGHEAEAVRSAISPYDVEVSVNARFAEGQSTSLLSGVNALPADIDAAVVMLADQPGIRVAAIDALIEARRTTRAPIVMTMYGDFRSHPVLFGRETFDALRGISGDKGAREVIQTYGDQVAVVEDGRPAPPADVDTDEAYAAMRRDGLPDIHTG